MEHNSQNILVISAHPDDGELMAGGLISKLTSEGKNVYHVSFTTDSRAMEILSSAGVLGVTDTILYDFPIRRLQNHRQEILEELINLNNKYKPELVITTSERDTHQDHPVVAREVFRAFKKTSSIICGELPWNNISFKKNLIVPLEEKDIKKKEEALNCYETQKDKFYMQNGAIRSLARSNGLQIDSEYAESFEIIRQIGI